MRVHLSIREMIDPGMTAAGDLSRMDESFGAAHPFVLLFRPPDGTVGFTQEQSRTLTRWIDDCAEQEEVSRVRSPLQIVRVHEDANGLYSEPRLDDLTQASLATLAGTPWQGVFTDDDCRDVAVEIVLRDTQGTTRYGSFDPAPVGALLESARREVADRHAGIAVHAAGAAAFEYHSLAGIRRFRLLNVAVVVLLLLLARLALGTWRAGPLLLLPLVVASAVVYGGMALRGDPIDLLSTGLFLLLAVAGIEDFFFLSRLRMHSGRRWRGPFRRLLLPGFLTSLTTVLGFGSLLVSDLEIVRRLGLWAALGALVEWGATFLVLPCVLQLVPSARDWTDRRRAWRIDSLELLSRARWPRPVGLGLLGVLVAGGVGAFHLDFRDSPERTFDRGHPYRRATAELRRTRGWAGTFSVVSPSIAGNASTDYEPEWERLDDSVRLLRPWEAVTAILDPERALDDLPGGRLGWLDELA
jgi:predicted RND superfamily exporter protein